MIRSFFSNYIYDILEDPCTIHNDGEFIKVFLLIQLGDILTNRI